MEPERAGAHDLPAFVAPPLSRADRRAVALGSTQRAGDLAISRMPESKWVFVGIRHGGRVRLSVTEARQLAGSLIELADDEETPE